MNVEIYFSSSEIREILKNNNYVIKTIDSYRSENTYHNNITYVDTKIEIAYLKNNKPSKEILDQEECRIIEEWGINNVFQEFFNNKIKKLLINQQ